MVVAHCCLTIRAYLPGSPLLYWSASVSYVFVDLWITVLAAMLMPLSPYSAFTDPEWWNILPLCSSEHSFVQNAWTMLIAQLSCVILQVPRMMWPKPYLTWKHCISWAGRCMIFILYWASILQWGWTDSVCTALQPRVRSWEMDSRSLLAQNFFHVYTIHPAMSAEYWFGTPQKPHIYHQPTYCSQADQGQPGSESSDKLLGSRKMWVCLSWSYGLHNWRMHERTRWQNIQSTRDITYNCISQAAPRHKQLPGKPQKWTQTQKRATS
jgi:hypothetical protein